MIEVMMLDGLVEPFKEWLADRGLELFKIPLGERQVDEGFECYGIGPQDRLVVPHDEPSWTGKADPNWFTRPG